MITDKYSEQLSLNFSLWTRKAVKELVERELGIALGLTTMGITFAHGELHYKSQRKKHMNKMTIRFKNGLSKNIQA